MEPRGGAHPVGGRRVLDAWLHSTLILLAGAGVSKEEHARWRSASLLAKLQDSFCMVAEGRHKGGLRRVRGPSSQSLRAGVRAG